MESSKQLHVARGFGAASRIDFDFEKLESYGWKVKIRESIVSGVKKTFFSYETPKGKILKSAKDAEKEMRETGIYELVLKCQENEAPQTEEVKDGCANSSTEEEDENYEPPSKQLRVVNSDHDHEKG
jgi:hypothetical protein